MDERFRRVVRDQMTGHPLLEEEEMEPVEAEDDAADMEDDAADEESTVESRSKRPRRMTYICAPYRPTSEDPERAKEELKENIRRMCHACRTASAFGYIPIAPALYFTSFLRDTVDYERKEGLDLGLECIQYCNNLVIVGNRISEGMREEIMEASRRGVEIVIWRNGYEPLTRLYHEVFKSTGGKPVKQADGSEECRNNDGSAKELKEEKDHE